jgi:hypothetical protein
MDLGCWRFGFSAEIQQSYGFEIVVAQICLDLIKAFPFKNPISIYI